MSVYHEWLRRSQEAKAKPQIRDERVRYGNVLFHLPYDPNRRVYLLFHCTGCGRCCDPLTKPLPITLRDVRRLTPLLGYKRLTEFLAEECVLAEYQERDAEYFITGRRVDASYVTYFLKRHLEESETSLKQPQRCRFLTVLNSCRIYESRPMICRKFPHLTIRQGTLIHVYYAKDTGMRCDGFQERPRVKRKWVSQAYEWVKAADEEVLETMQQGFYAFTEVTFKK